MSTLATLTQQIEALCNEIDEVGGEIPADLLERFADIKASHEQKCGAYVAVISALHHNSAYYHNRAEILKRRANTCDRVEKAIKNRLVYQLTNEPNVPYVSKDGDKITLRDSPESLDLKILTRTRSFSNVLDSWYPKIIQPEFIDVVTLNCINTDKVKKFLQAGGKLDWAELKRDKHIRIT